MLSNNVNFDGPLFSVADQLEEMRRVLGSVHREVSGDCMAPARLDELIGELLGYGVTRHEIAYLISEALPMK
ncbi:hypothetical protein EON83_13700 [bacterium]|nr:MAG: hypothetical protein EON83_13700 [bacterium]